MSPAPDADFWFDADYAAHAPSFCAGTLFSGVGIGIALGNEYVLAGCILTSPRKRYGKAPGRFLACADCTYAFNVLEKTRHRTNAMVKTEQQIMSWWLLAILYGLRDLVISSSRLTCRSWRKMLATIVNRPSLDVSRLINCAWLLGWLWAAKRWGALPCLTANLWCRLLVCCLLSPATRLSCLSQQSWFWRYLYGYDISGDDYPRQLSVPGNLNLLGFVTLIYALGKSSARR